MGGEKRAWYTLFAHAQFSQNSMQVTKGTWRMREQCVPGSLSSSPAREPGNEASEVGIQAEICRCY